MLDCGFAEFLYQGLSLSFIAQCLSQNEGGLCLAGCHVVAQTQGYHLVCIWGGLFKFQGGGVVLKFDCFRTGMQFFVLFYASNDLLCC